MLNYFVNTRLTNGCIKNRMKLTDGNPYNKTLAFFVFKNNFRDKL